MERQLDDEGSLELFSCNDGCCRECTSLITTAIVCGCYDFVNDDINYALHYLGMAPEMSNVPGPKNIVHRVDKSSMLCLWVANILQYEYIKLALKWNHHLMPTILITLYQLMLYAHVLYKENVKIYMNRRKNVYYSIWRLAQQIILNHRYIKRYYNRYDINKERLCDRYIVQMTEWLVNELQILQDIVWSFITMERSASSDYIGSYIQSLRYDYVGAVVVLMSLVASKEEFEMSLIFGKNLPDFATKNGKNGVIRIFNILRFVHSVTHNRKELAKFWKESIIRCRKMKLANRIKCHWRDCKRWGRSEKFFRCKRCRNAVYCSKRCQKKDWKRGPHKIACYRHCSLIAQYQQNCINCGYECICK